MWKILNSNKNSPTKEIYWQQKFQVIKALRLKNTIENRNFENKKQVDKKIFILKRKIQWLQNQLTIEIPSKKKIPTKTKIPNRNLRTTAIKKKFTLKIKIHRLQKQLTIEVPTIEVKKISPTKKNKIPNRNLRNKAVNKKKFTLK